MQSGSRSLLITTTLGIMGFLFTMSLGYFYFQKTDSLAVIKILKGEVLHTVAAESEPQVQSRQFMVNDLDSLFVSEKGEALFISPEGYEILLSQAAQVSLEKRGPQTFLILHSGQLSLKKAGLKESVWIESPHTGALEAYQFFERQKEIAASPEELPPRPDFRESMGSEKSLNDRYISEKISSQKKFFKKCYNHLVQKKPDIQGMAQVFFRLEGNGKVSYVNVSKNNYEDRQFNQCVEEVVKRMRFKAFRGESLELAFKLSPL